MSQFFHIHPDNPQLRLIRQAVDILRQGEVIVYPTDSAYALGCLMGEKRPVETMRRIRQVDQRHNFTLVCRDLSEIATYARVDNRAYRIMRKLTPGPFTFIFKATGEVPRRLMHPKRKTIGIRVPDNPIALALLEELGQPLMSTTLIMPGDELPLVDPEEMRERLQHEVGLVIDGGGCGIEPTTVVNMVEDPPVVTRQGMGDFSEFE